MELLSFAGIVALIKSLDAAALILVFCFTLLGYSLYKAHISTSDFDLKDMIRGTTTGKADIYKFGQLISLFVTSWVISFMAVNGHLTEGYFGLYLISWAGSIALNKYLSIKSNTVSESTTTTTATADKIEITKEEVQK